MSETPAAPSGRAALELGITQLSKLRNQTGPTIAFKKWRQTLIDAINGLWPEDRTKASRFLRIPFLPASAKADRMEVRRVYDKGCGEAMSYIKGLIAEHDREIATGARAPVGGGEAAGGALDADGLPNLSWLEAAPEPPLEVELPADESGELRGLTDEFLSSSPVFSVRGASGGPRNEPGKQELSPTALAIMAMAVEIESLGIPEGDRPRVREALLDLARKLDSSQLSWRQLRITLEVVMEYPAVGRRVLPMIVPFLDRAA